jgi:hypothetical protein
MDIILLKIYITLIVSSRNVEVKLHFREPRYYERKLIQAKRRQLKT